MKVLLQSSGKCGNRLRTIESVTREKKSFGEKGVQTFLVMLVLESSRETSPKDKA